MKIVCDSCATKYSIADEKVRGKVFKIRCKKCQHIIVVRGAPAPDEATAEPQPAAAQEPPADEGVWHVVIGRDQVGPMTEDEIRARFGRGEIDGQTYTWREGLADWLRLQAVEEFRDLASAESSAAALPSAEVQQPPWAADEPESSSLQEGAPQQGWGDTRRADADALAQAHADAADLASGPDLFASSAGLHNSPVAAQPHDPSPGSAATAFPSVSPSQQLFPEEGLDDSDEPVHLTGQRREESVLFSLNNLQSLAMGKKPAYSPASSLVPEDDTAGSGLIDIRALAAEQQMVGDFPDDNDLAPIPAVAAANVLMPSGSGADRPWLVPLLGVMAVLLIGAVGAVFYLMSQDPAAPRAAREVALNTAGQGSDNAVVENAGTPTAAPATNTTVALKPATPATTPETSVDPEKTPAVATTAVPTTAAPTTAAPTEVKPASAAPTKVAVAPKKATRRKASRSTRKREAKRVRPSTPKVSVVETRSKPSKPAKNDSSLDELIDGAIKKKKSGKTAAPKTVAQPASGQKLPASLERNDIQAGFRRIKGRVSACFDKYKVPGLVMANTTIAGTGKVSAVAISGKFKGTPTGRCVAAAVRTARFAKFSGVPMKIPYPYSFR